MKKTTKLMSLSTIIARKKAYINNNGMYNDAMYSSFKVR